MSQWLSGKEWPANGQKCIQPMVCRNKKHDITTDNSITTAYHHYTVPILGSTGVESAWPPLSQVDQWVQNEAFGWKDSPYVNMSIGGAAINRTLGSELGEVMTELDWYITDNRLWHMKTRVRILIEFGRVALLDFAACGREQSKRLCCRNIL